MKTKNQNDELQITVADFSFEELEQRLETDPLFLSHLINLGTEGEGGFQATCKRCETACNNNHE